MRRDGVARHEDALVAQKESCVDVDHDHRDDAGQPRIGNRDRDRRGKPAQRIEVGGGLDSLGKGGSLAGGGVRAIIGMARVAEVATRRTLVFHLAKILIVTAGAPVALATVAATPPRLASALALIKNEPAAFLCIGTA